MLNANGGSVPARLVSRSKMKRRVTRREIEGYLRVIRPKKKYKPCSTAAVDAAALKTRRAVLERRR